LSRGEYVPHNRLTFGAAEVEAVRRVVESGQWTGGPRVADLETALVQASGVRYAAAVGSGLAALRLALKGLGVGRGDTVLVPAYSCVALPNAVLSVGATPIAVDVERDDWNLSVEATKRHLAEARPKAIIAVHTFGAPASIPQLMDLGVPVVEDCAHAFGLHAAWGPLARQAHAAVLSFHATKLLAGGEGGAVLTSSERLAGFVRRWRDYDGQPPDGDRLNDKMTDLEAALTLCQLGRLQEMIAARRRLAERYNGLLEGHQLQGRVFRLPDIARDRIWYRYVAEMIGVSGDAMRAHLAAHGVHSPPPVRDWRDAVASDCPLACTAYQRLVSLPLYPTLTDEEQERVAYAFLAGCQDSIRR
jgi:perosamine synthetase